MYNTIFLAQQNLGALPLNATRGYGMKQCTQIAGVGCCAPFVVLHLRANAILTILKKLSCSK